MRKWIGAGRYELNRGIFKRLWSAYHSLYASTGGSSIRSVVKIGSPSGPTLISPNLQTENNDDIMSEDSTNINIEQV